MPYKIAHLTTVHPTFDVRIFHKECKSIARAGYEVTLIASHDRDECREGVQILALPKWGGRLSRMIRGTWVVYRKAIRLNADLYHFHDPELLLVGLLLRMHGKLVVYDVHEPLSSDITAKHYIPRKLRRPLAKMIGMFESMSSRFLSGAIVANATSFPLTSFQSDCQALVNNYPILQEFQLASPNSWNGRSSAVGYVGVLSKDRCLPEMVRAISLVHKDLEPSLRLAGIFSPDSLRNEVSGTEGWERTCVMGVLDRTGVTRLLADVRAGLAVLKPTPAYLETIAVKMFEYMAAGIPVIASDFPQYRDIVESARCGLLVQPDNPADIARAIEFILTHPAEAQEMGQRGREAVATRYNWAVEERELLRLYRNLLESPCAA